MRHALLAVAATLLLSDPALAAPKAKRAKPAPAPVYAYVVPDGSPGEACVADCLKGVASKLRGRRGVRKVSVEGANLALEIQPGVFRAADVIKGIDGMKVEMRVPYGALEVRYVEGAPFPPIAREEGGALLVEIGDDVKKALEAAVSFKFAERMKCFGKLTGSVANEAVLQRYEDEKRPPLTMIPFLAEADLDGDRRPDLYLRFEGMPEVVVFNRAQGFKAVPVKRGGVDVIPRCDASPIRFARPVARSKVKCMKPVEHAGDAFERVQHNRSSELLMWDGAKFVTCEPLGEGAMPEAPRPPKDATKKPEDDEFEDW